MRTNTNAFIAAKLFVCLRELLVGVSNRQLREANGSRAGALVVAGKKRWTKKRKKVCPNLAHKCQWFESSLALGQV